MNALPFEPCPCCGSSVDMYEFEYPNGEHAYRLISVLGGCMVCESIKSIGPTELDAFIAAWNRRASGDALRIENDVLRESYVEDMTAMRELVLDLWPRASFTMGAANRDSYIERMVALGIEVEGVSE